MTPPLARFYEFLDRPLRPWTRWSLPLLCLPLLLAFWQPLWRISMEAPQYPNGLWMEVYVHELRAGHDGHDITEINTLNHYIGMHQIVPADFAELGYIPFVLGALVLLALRVAAIGNVRMLVDLAVGSGYALGFLFARFIYRLYVFGHDLDPRAPFDTEPFTPVIVGTKQIANFTTHSFPQAGSYLVGVFAVGVIGMMTAELWLGRRRALGAARDTVAAPTPSTASVAPQPADR